jgi:hypothetical protein
MTLVTAWQTADPCPDCGGELTLLDDGAIMARLECSSCGYADTVPLADPAGGDR